MVKKRLGWVILGLCIGVFGVLLWPELDVQEADIFIPVTFENMPEGIAFASPPPKGVEVRAQGPKPALDRLQSHPPTFALSISDIAPGVANIPIPPQNLPLPKGITAVQIQPAVVTLRVEKKISKSLPITVTICDHPAHGYHVSATRAQPSALWVTGPEKILAPLRSIGTKPVSLLNKFESFKKEVALALSEGLTVKSGKHVVVAEITVEEKVNIETFEKIHVESINTPHHVTIIPATITIEVKGPEKILDQLKSNQNIRVTVDLKDLNPGVYVRRAAVDLPVGTTLAGVSPEIFTVTIKRHSP